jgi:hypothetical protein
MASSNRKLARKGRLIFYRRVRLSTLPAVGAFGSGLDSRAASNSTAARSGSSTVRARLRRGG